MNPYQPSQTAPVPAASRGRGLVRGVLFAVAGYYALSILTLPFANKVWWGEVPLLALPQLPKIWLHSWTEQLLQYWFPWHGTNTIEHIVRHYQALAVACVVPALVAFLLSKLALELKSWRRWVLLIGVLLIVDVAVTFAFDRMSSLSLF